MWNIFGQSGFLGFLGFRKLWWDSGFNGYQDSGIRIPGLHKCSTWNIYIYIFGQSGRFVVVDSGFNGFNGFNGFKIVKDS